MKRICMLRQTKPKIKYYLMGDVTTGHPLVTKVSGGVKKNETMKNVPKIEQTTNVHKENYS